MPAHYLSWSSQNEFIEECAKLVTQVIVNELKASFHFGIIVDGTQDVSHTEQVTFVVRYVHQSEESTWEIKEWLLGIEECAKKRKRHCFTHYAKFWKTII